MVLNCTEVVFSRSHWCKPSFLQALVGTLALSAGGKRPSRGPRQLCLVAHDANYVSP